MTQNREMLRLCLGLIQIAFNKAFGYTKGRKNDLSRAGIGIIYGSYHYDRMNMTDVARMYGVTKSTATDYVNTLENKGYVRRIKDDGDRRDIYIVPTDKAKTWVEENEERIYEYVQTGMDRLTPEEQETLVKLLLKFVGSGDGGKTYKELVEETLGGDSKDRVDLYAD